MKYKVNKMYPVNCRMCVSLKNVGMNVNELNPDGRTSPFKLTRVSVCEGELLVVVWKPL